MKNDHLELFRELDRFKVAYATGLADDVEPISRKAVDQGLRLLSEVGTDSRMPAELTEPIRSALRHAIGALGWVNGVTPDSARRECITVLELMDRHTEGVVENLRDGAEAR